jgi:DNA-binding CsgD family transcriptional regulator/tetratricopeptide (TPR) repeat protein
LGEACSEQEMGLPLVGREGERALLRNRLADVVSGIDATVVIRGPTGVGKTRLLSYLQAQVRERGLNLLNAACSPDGSGIPLLPIRDALATFLNQTDQEGRKNLLSGLEFELRPVLQETAREFAHAEFQPEAEAAREATRTNEAVTRLIGRMTTVRATVLIVDDLQWADRATVRLLHWLRRRLEAQRMLMVLAVRSDEPSGDPLSDVQLGALMSEASEISLAGLSWRESRRLLRELLPSQLEPDVDQTTRLVEFSGGNPLYLVHAARAISDGQNPFTLPRGAREMLAGRLWQLGPDARDVLAAAAVIGQEFDVSLLSALAERDEAMLLPILRLASESLILGETDVPRTLAFVHPLAREAALRHHLRVEQSRMHERLLTLLTGRPGGAHPSVLALHAEAAGRSAECVTYALEAAAVAWGHGRFHESALQLDRAVRATSEAGEPSDDLLFKAATAWAAAGRASRAAELFDELADRNARRGDKLAVADATARSARIYLVSSSEERLRKAAADIEPLGPTPQLAMVLAAWVHAVSGGLSSGSGDLFDASARALHIARSAGSQEALAAALLARGHLIGNGGDYEEGCRLLEECRQVASQCGATRDEHAAIVNLLSLLAKAGRWTAARELATTAVQSALDQGAHRRAGQLLARLADVERQTGHWDEAREHAASAILFTDEEDPQAARAAREAAAMLAADAGDWAEVESSSERELAGLPARTSFFPYGPWIALRMMARQARGNVAASVADAEELQDLWRTSGDAFYGARFSEASAAVFCDAGRIDEADSVLHRVERRLARLPEPIRAVAEGSRYVCAALVLAARGDMPAAMTLWQTAGEAFSAVGIPYRAARANAEAARCALEAGLPELRPLARSLLVQAHSCFQELGSREAGVTGLMLRRQRWAAPPSSSAELTEREAGIALLVAEGLTSQQIADRLVLSRRTVENHLARTFQKLGIHSRAALVSVAQGHRPVTD